MSIEGSKRVLPPRDGPAPSGYTVDIVRFTPIRAGDPDHPVNTVPDLHAVLEPYRGHERLAVFLERDGGDAGAIWVHLTGERAWVTHFTKMGGIDSYCRDLAYAGPDSMFEFLLDNGQLEEIHRYWTVTRAEGLRALDYFLEHGERDPALSWVEEPPVSLRERMKDG